MNNCCISWFFTHIFTGILIFKGLTARRLYKSFGIKGLMNTPTYPGLILRESNKINQFGTPDLNLTSLHLKWKPTAWWPCEISIWCEYGK
jgi:hypothetical protein